MSEITILSNSADETFEFGRCVGAALRGGEIIQLVSDIGGGKTTFVKGLATGMGSDETVQSPTFIISALYECNGGKLLYHYDFYRLDDPGIMSDQLTESLNDPQSVSVIEWGGIVSNVINRPTITIVMRAEGETQRQLRMTLPDEYDYIDAAVKEFV